MMKCTSYQPLAPVFTISEREYKYKYKYNLAMEKLDVKKKYVSIC